MAAKQNKIDTLHQQYYDTCLLSSYAVVGNYFTGLPIDNFFKSYYYEYASDFRSIGIISPNGSNYRNIQHKHINQLGISKKQSGYQILHDLHFKSNQSAFKKCYSIFNCEYIKLNNGIITSGTYKNKHINDFLKCPDKDTVINVFLGNKPNKNMSAVFCWLNMHSITIYYDNDFFYHNTNNPSNDAKNKLNPDWWKCNNITNTLIYWEK